MAAFIFYQNRLGLKLPREVQRESLSGFINKMVGFLSLLKYGTDLLLQVYFSAQWIFIYWWIFTDAFLTSSDLLALNTRILKED